jgi:serine/threonine protein kinase
MLGRYKIEAHLGTGAFADVYKAVDQTLDRTVAPKVLKLENKRNQTPK